MNYVFVYLLKLKKLRLSKYSTLFHKVHRFTNQVCFRSDLSGRTWSTSPKARIYGATLRAILRATSVTRRGYTVATFRATSRAIFDQRLPSSHRFSLKLWIINIRSVNCTFVKPNINIYTETKRPFAAFPRATATPCCHASNIKADKRSEWKYPEQNVWIPNHRWGLGKKITYLCNSQLKNFPLQQTKPSFYVKRTTCEN